MALEAPGGMVLREFPLSETGPQEGLLMVEVVGVCGSEVGIYKGKATRAPRPYSIIMGHEISGTIAEIGEEGHSSISSEGGRKGSEGRNG